MKILTLVLMIFLVSCSEEDTGSSPPPFDSINYIQSSNWLGDEITLGLDRIADFKELEFGDEFSPILTTFYLDMDQEETTFKVRCQFSGYAQIEPIGTHLGVDSETIKITGILPVKASSSRYSGTLDTVGSSCLVTGLRNAKELTVTAVDGYISMVGIDLSDNVISFETFTETDRQAPDDVLLRNF